MTITEPRTRRYGMVLRRFEKNHCKLCSRAPAILWQEPGTLAWRSKTQRYGSICDQAFHADPTDPYYEIGVTPEWADESRFRTMLQEATPLCARHAQQWRSDGKPGIGIQRRWFEGEGVEEDGRE